MTRPSSASAPDDLFDAIARLLEPEQRAYFYQRMLYFRHLRPEDELLRLVEAIGLLALLIRDAPHAVAREREQMAQLLESTVETMHAIGEAGQTYQRQLDDRLAVLPTDLAQRINPTAIASVLTESLRQQFVQSGLPATADAMRAVSQQLTDATGRVQHAGSQLAAYAGMANQARAMLDHVSASVTTATERARSAVEQLTQQVRTEWVRAVWLLCGAAWLVGVLGGIAIERWRVGGSAASAEVAAPPSPAQTTSAKPPLEPSRPSHRDSHTTVGPASDPRRGTVMEQRSNTSGTATSTREAKP